MLPGWCRELDTGALHFVLDHEREHIRAGDLRLLPLVGAIPVSLPWHLPVWWQLSRLRTAVEGDYGLRVLRRHPGQIRSYIRLLLDMGSRPGPARPLATMLSEPYATLRRRIRIMTMATTAADPVAEPADVVQARPTFTPYSDLPRLENRAEVAAALGRRHAPVSDAPAGEVTADVWFFVTEEGRVQDTRVSRSSGTPALDRTVLETAAKMEFSPALNRDQARAVWVSLPVAFVRERGGQTGVADSGAGDARGRIIPTSPPDALPEGADGGSAEGVVVDATTGRPLALVQVFVRGTERGTLTDGQGRFRIDGDPAGSREVVAHLVGYDEVGTRVAIPTDGTVNLEVGMRATAIPLDTLIVPLGGGD